jgi:hypothetical protein
LAQLGLVASTKATSAARKIGATKMKQVVGEDGLAAFEDVAD